MGKIIGKETREELVMEVRCGRYGIIRTDDEVDFDNEHRGNYVICANDELVRAVDMIRYFDGCLDLVSENFVNEAKENPELREANTDNDVWYNFYLMFNLKKDEIKLQAQCNNGEKDDFVFYELPLYKEEKKEMRLWLLRQLAKDLYNN